MTVFFEQAQGACARRHDGLSWLTVQGDWPDDVNDLTLMPRSNGLEGATPALIVEINDFSWLTQI